MTPIAVRWLLALWGVTGIACAEPTLRFFSSVEGAHRLGRVVADTVLVLRIGNPDSVDPHGVDLAFDLLDRANEAQHGVIADRIEQVLSMLPAAARVRSSKRGRREADLVSQLSGQSLINQVVLLRADYLVVSDVMADTVEITVEDPAEHEAARTDRWLSLVVTGQTAVADSS